MDDNYVELLFVQEGLMRQVVEAPVYKAEVGDLVEYIVQDPAPEGPFWKPPEKTVIGLVLKKMVCQRFDNEWSCVAELARIRQATAVYSCKWSKSQKSETASG